MTPVFKESLKILIEELVVLNRRLAHEEGKVYPSLAFIDELKLDIDLHQKAINKIIENL